MQEVLDSAKTVCESIGSQSTAYSSRHALLTLLAPASSRSTGHGCLQICALARGPEGDDEGGHSDNWGECRGLRVRICELTEESE